MAPVQPHLDLHFETQFAILKFFLAHAGPARAFGSEESASAKETNTDRRAIAENKEEKNVVKRKENEQ